MRKILLEFMARLLYLSHSDMYIGRSSLKLLRRNLLQLVFFFLSARPDKNRLIATKQLYNSKIGKVALVLGNGPSLDRLDTSKIDIFVNDIFVVNDFYKLSVSSGVQPTYYVLSDPASFWEDSQTISETKKLESYLGSTGSTLILPHNTRESFLPQISRIYFDDRDYFLFNKNIEPIRPRGYIPVTLYKAIAMACYFGYEKIFVLGLENTEFFSYEGSLKNKLMVKARPYAHKKTEYQQQFEDIAVGYNNNSYPYSIAGRMQAYAYLFGDLELFPKSRIRLLNEKSLVDLFVKEPQHPLVFGE
jgi:hypothetical protein